jgi:hemoglobin/transferrin/lactoferrin receptor protein
VFNDKVRTSDSRGNSNVTTPGGERTVSGGFVQLKNNYSTWLEIVSALRYDRYDLDSATVSTGGDRFSPKVSVGVTPVAGFTPYVSYAEGYRAPSITETLIAGEHATGGGPPLFPCPGGTAGLFCFLPNPGLRPEVGKNKEAASI